MGLDGNLNNKLNSFLLNFRNINGFLNTGKGGTIYLGIVDDGRVKGLLMTQYQVSECAY